MCFSFFRDSSKVTQLICGGQVQSPGSRPTETKAFSTHLYSSFMHTMVMGLAGKLNGHGSRGIKSSLNCNVYDSLQTHLFLHLVLFGNKCGWRWQEQSKLMMAANRDNWAAFAKPGPTSSS